MDVPRMYTMLCISKLTDGGIYTAVNIVNSREEVASLLRYYIGPPSQEVAATQSNRLWRKEYTILNFHLWSTNSVSSSGGAPDIPVVYKSPRRLLLLQTICKCIVFSAQVQGILHPPHSTLCCLQYDKKLVGSRICGMYLRWEYYYASLSLQKTVRVTHLICSGSSWRSSSSTLGCMES